MIPQVRRTIQSKYIRLHTSNSVDVATNAPRISIPGRPSMPCASEFRNIIIIQNIRIRVRIRTICVPISAEMSPSSSPCNNRTQTQPAMKCSG